MIEFKEVSKHYFKRWILIVLGLIGVSFLLSLIIPLIFRSEPSVSEPPISAEGKVAFARDGDIWVINKDGSEEKKITSDGLNGLPKWSLDGRYLSWIHLVELPSGAYETDEETGEEVEIKEKRGNNIYLKDLQTGSIEKLLTPIPEEQLKGRGGAFKALNSYDWSPDSQKIVYAADGVWIKDFSSKQETKIADDYYDPSDDLGYWNYASVQYSPTGENIFLIKGKYEALDWEVFSVATSEKKILSTEWTPFDIWGPGGDTLLGGGRCGVFAGGVHLYDLKSDKIKTLLDDEAAGIAWSQTSNLIAIAKGFGSSSESYQGPCSSAEFDIFIMDREGKNLRRLTSDKKRKAIVGWSPDGKWVLYTVSERFLYLHPETDELWIVNKEGTANLKLTKNISEPVWSPK